MAFQVPAADIAGGEDFDFQIHKDDCVVAITGVGECSCPQFKVRKVNLVPITTLDEIESSTAALVAFFSGSAAKQRKAVEQLNRNQFAALVTAWREDSEVTAGESPASES